MPQAVPGGGDGGGLGHPQHDWAKLHLSGAALCGAEGSRQGVSPGLPDIFCREAAVPSAQGGACLTPTALLSQGNKVWKEPALPPSGKRAPHPASLPPLRTLQSSQGAQTLPPQEGRPGSPQGASSPLPRDVDGRNPWCQPCPLSAPSGPATLALGKGSSGRDLQARLFMFVEASGVQSQEERPGGWAPQLLRKLWRGWFPGSDRPETQKHE